MIFSELYSAYYNAVAKIIACALNGELTDKKMQEIVEEISFGESALTITPSLKTQKWQLITADNSTPIKSIPTMPLTILQKRWLKSVMSDKRVKLFGISISGLDDTEPLFTDEDYYIFDKYSDGDDFTDGTYIKHFRLILGAINEHFPIMIEQRNRRGQLFRSIVSAERLEYSEKDDKFRLITSGCRYCGTVNLSRIIRCEKANEAQSYRSRFYSDSKRSVTLELFNSRNALERVMLHFAHFEKQAEQLDGRRYRVTVFYNVTDETEIVIRVLSFGPLVKVIEPNRFVNLIKERLIKQKNCGI